MRKNKKRNHQKHPVPNHKYKDRLFRLVFNNKRDLLDLYNALNNTCYENPNDLEVNTLEDAVYLSMKMIFHSDRRDTESLNIRARIIQICHCAD